MRCTTAGREVFAAEHEAFCAEVDRGVETLLDPCRPEAPAEFFAVACEVFFVAPATMLAAQLIRTCIDACW